MSDTIDVRIYPEDVGRPSYLWALPESQLGVPFALRSLVGCDDDGVQLTFEAREIPYRILPAGTILEELWVAIPQSWLDEQPGGEYSCSWCRQSRPGMLQNVEGCDRQICGLCQWELSTRRPGSAGAAYDAQR